MAGRDALADAAVLPGRDVLADAAILPGRDVLAGAAILASDIVLAAAVSDLAAVVMALVAAFIACMAADMVLAEDVALVAAAVIFVAAEVTFVAADDTVRAAAAADATFVAAAVRADLAAVVRPAWFFGRLASRLGTPPLVDRARGLAGLGRRAVLAVVRAGTDLPPSRSITGVLFHELRLFTPARNVLPGEQWPQAAGNSCLVALLTARGPIGQ